MVLKGDFWCFVSEWLLGILNNLVKIGDYLVFSGGCVA